MANTPRQRLGRLLLALVCGGCAIQEPLPETVAEPAASAEAETVPIIKPKPKPRPERIESQPLKHLAMRNLKAMPVRALNVETKCAFRDAVGTRGNLDLRVKNAEVQRFSAEVTIPKRGICHFNMRNFRQTASLPAVLLNDSDSKCLVRMWEQEHNVTVAFSGCEARCSGESFSYLWPILIDTRNGRCS